MHLKWPMCLITCTVKFHSWINLSFKDKNNQNNLKYEKHNAYKMLFYHKIMSVTMATDLKYIPYVLNISPLNVI